MVPRTIHRRWDGVPSGSCALAISAGIGSPAAVVSNSFQLARSANRTSAGTVTARCRTASVAGTANSWDHATGWSGPESPIANANPGGQGETGPNQLA